MFATGEIVGLAEWIIDDINLVSFFFQKYSKFINMKWACNHAFEIYHFDHIKANM